MPKISVIIPCFNAEKYIHKCMNSLIKQTFNDYEIICINDCSTDNTLLILEEFKRKSNKITILNLKINKGSNNARKLGIKLARGCYIAYIDSDDYVASDYLESLYNGTHDETIDCVVSSGHYTKYKFIKFKSISTENVKLEEVHKIFFTQIGKFASYSWGKLYRKSCIENIPPINVFFQEDVLFNIKAFLNIKNINVIDYVGYYYRVGGLSSTNKNYICDIKIVYKQKKKLLALYNLNHLSDYPFYELINCFYEYIIRLIISKTPKKEILKIISHEKKDIIYKDVYFLKNINNCDVEYLAITNLKDEKIYQIAKSRITFRRRFGYLFRRLCGY